MKSKLLLGLCLIYLNLIPLFAQQITGQIIDAKTNEPIAFATIQFGKYNGVVSNTEGFFTLPTDQLKPQDVLVISFMGYQIEELSLDDLKKNNNLVKLNEAINQLDTVYVTNTLPSVDSIIAKANRNLEKNYQQSSAKQTVFTRETSFFKANDLDMDIEKSSGFNQRQLSASNDQFKALTDEIVNNPPTRSFTDVLMTLYFKPDSVAKMEVLKATQLIDRKNSLSLETIQDKVTTIILQHLDSTKTYKVKTGWFKIEDSLSLKSSEVKMVEKDSVNNMKDEFNNLKTQTLNKIDPKRFKNESMLHLVLNTDDYDYELDNITTVDDQLIYIIKFEPRRRRSKFEGTLYVNGEDYAIKKLDYQFAKGKVGEKLNLKLLLGVKYIEKINSGTILYKRTAENGSYHPYYINLESSRYVYAHRPFKFTENADDRRNKVSFDMTIEGDIVEKYELMSLDHKKLDNAIFDGLTESKTVDFIQLKAYDPLLWKDYAIMEPLEELKKFQVED